MTCLNCKKTSTTVQALLQCVGEGELPFVGLTHYGYNQVVPALCTITSIQAEYAVKAAQCV